MHRFGNLPGPGADACPISDGLDRSGILLTGTTGLLDGHGFARAARGLPPGRIVYCFGCGMQRGAQGRLDAVTGAYASRRTFKR